MTKPIYLGNPNNSTTNYPNVNKATLPFKPGATVSTLLPYETALLRTISALVSSVLLVTFPKMSSVAIGCTSSFIFMRWSLLEMNYLHSGLTAALVFGICNFMVLKLISITAIACGIFGLWTAYAHLYKDEDPLIIAFHEIVGGKEQFDKLPEIQFDESKTLLAQLRSLTLDKLNTISRGNLNGRQIVVVKGAFFKDKTDVKIFAFVEKISPFDYPPFFSTLPPKVDRLLALALQALPSFRFSFTTTPHFQEASYADTFLYAREILKNTRFIKKLNGDQEGNIMLAPGFRTETANELFVQLNNSNINSP